MPRILVIDDDPGLLSVCSVGLQALGHTVHTAETGEDGISQAALHAPDVIVLDLGLPDLDGLVVCKRIRTWSEVPVIVLSADGSEDRKVDALEHGADDYMTKPFGMRELHARVHVALRHHRAEDGSEEQLAELDVGSLHLDLVHRQATFDGRPLDLTPRELDFLAFLARNAGKVCTRRMILENVWGPGYASELHYLKVYAYRIRRKLGDEQGKFLQSDPSVGYRLAPDLGKPTCPRSRSSLRSATLGRPRRTRGTDRSCALHNPPTSTCDQHIQHRSKNADAHAWRMRSFRD